jgi:GDPmannose 4,6-dehydratase
LGIDTQLEIVAVDLADGERVRQLIAKLKPDQVYHLASMSSVGMSFANPRVAIVSNLVSTANLLDAIKTEWPQARLLVAGSGEVFGDTGDLPANERTPFRPQSPYAVAKAAAAQLVTQYRENYGLFACTAILFNHESPLRPEGFVTRKITDSAVRIALGGQEKLKLGDLTVMRDWGWAPEFVRAMHQMLALDRPIDLVIATGQTISLADFVESAFTAVGLDWRDHVETDRALIRPKEPKIIMADATQAQLLLGWKASLSGRQIAEQLVTSRLNLETRQAGRPV